MEILRAPNFAALMQDWRSLELPAPAPSETNEGPLVVEGEVPATWSASFGTRSALKMMGWDGIETLEVLDILWRVGGFDMI